MSKKPKTPLQILRRRALVQHHHDPRCGNCVHFIHTGWCELHDATQIAHGICLQWVDDTPCLPT
jgi:hypothetical protein